MAENILDCLQSNGTYTGHRDILILAPRLDEDSKTGKERNKGELNQDDFEMLTREGIPRDCWKDEVKLIKAKFLKDVQILQSSIYTYDRDECDVYSILNVKADNNMTVGSAMEAIIDLLQNTNKNGGK